MYLKRNVGLKGLRYRGGGPMLTFILHRLGGLAMVLFVGGHILLSFFSHQMASSLATDLNAIYESIYFQVFLYFGVIFHALNGTRIIVLDTWPKLLEYQREATWLEWLIFIPVYGLTVFIMVMRALQGA